MSLLPSSRNFLNSRSASARRAAGLALGLALWGGLGADAIAQSDPAGAPSSSIPALLSLTPGEIWSLSGENITRIAVGNPNVADVTVVSEHEALVQARAAGTTNVILWDDQGEHNVAVQVVDRSAEVVEQQLSQLIGELNLDVQVKREGNRLILIGHVPSEEDYNRLEVMLTHFSNVSNLVKVVEPEKPIVAPLLVRLMVQLIEISRSDLEELGVRWFDSVQLTQPEATDMTSRQALFRWGNLVTRGEVSTFLNALVTRNKARILAEPKLVTTNGKEASSQLGLDIPIITTTTVGTGSGTTSASIDFRKTGVLLKMVPNIDLRDPERKITMSMETEVTKIDNTVALNVPVGGQTVSVPGFKVRKATTEVTTTSGETVVIAGLLEMDESHNVTQVPALGSMPLLGRFFRSPEKEANQLELVIAITPELLDDTRVTMEKAVALEQALAVTEVVAPVSDPTLRYALRVQERVAKSLQFPQQDELMGRPAETKIRLRLLRDGTLKDAQVSQSSGFEAFDQAAVRAAKAQSPFPMFPPELVEAELWLEVPILFRP